MGEPKFDLPHKHLQPAQYASWVRKVNDPDWYQHRYRNASDRSMAAAIRELIEARGIAFALYEALEAALLVAKPTVKQGYRLSADLQSTGFYEVTTWPQWYVDGQAVLKSARGEV